MIYIAVDAMGGDFAPEAAVRGVLDALHNREGFGVILVGRQDVISQWIETIKPSDFIASKRLIVQNASQVISGDDNPTTAIKSKKDSSMLLGLALVRDGEAKAFVSGGNTGALLTGGLTVIGRIKGVQRPALGVMLPGLGSLGYTFLIDAGANMDAKAAYLEQFAHMGSVYMETMYGIRPRVGLVNVGSEPAKGNAVAKEAYKLLEQSGLNFTGNLESRELPLGGADVAVCDGFVGNIILKHMEGLSKAILTIIKKELMSSLTTKVGAVLSKKAFDNVKKGFDSGETGGAPLLGLNGLVVKAHGNSDPKAFMNAVFQAADFVGRGAIEKLTKILG